jgi:hypothetical protein
MAPDPAPLQTLGLNAGDAAVRPASTDSLQFQRAEYAGAGPDCAFCKKSAGPSYFQVGRAVACPNCAAQLQRLQTPPDRGVMLRATLYGLGAAIAGSILFALVSLTGFQFSIIAILVGYMVGKAIVKATRGRSSRAVQVMAVVLTYGAITTSYLPIMISAAIKQHKTKKAETPQVETPKRGTVTPGAAVAGLGAAIAVLIGFSFILPFLVLAQSPVSGLINLVIIFIGLSKAWRLTTPFRAPILGPYTGSEAR